MIDGVSASWVDPELFRGRPALPPAPQRGTGALGLGHWVPRGAVFFLHVAWTWQSGGGGGGLRRVGPGHFCLAL